MDVKTLADLIDWTRKMHKQLARCLRHCADRHEEERATALLEYLAKHEQRLQTLVDDLESQADRKAMKTWIYDHMAHTPLKTHRVCDTPYSEMAFNDIAREVLDVHGQIMDMYRSLISRTEISEGKEVLDEMLEMEKNESRQVSEQIGRMQDI